MAAQQILIIDDDKIMCAELAEILQAEGYDVTTADGGAAGAALLKSRYFDSVILDYSMPWVTGVDILKRLKDWGFKRKVLVVTGHPSIVAELDGQGLYGTVHAVLPKPLNIPLLLQTLKA